MKHIIVELSPQTIERDLLALDDMLPVLIKAIIEVQRQQPLMELAQDFAKHCTENGDAGLTLAALWIVLSGVLGELHKQTAAIQERISAAPTRWTQ